MTTPTHTQTPAAVQRHIERLQDSSALERQNAATALGKLHHPDAVEPLINLLWNEKDKVVRSRAIQALEFIGDERAVEPLITMLRSEFDPVRGKDMLRVATKLGGPTIAGRLLQLLNNHKSPPIQRQIVDMLGEIRYAAAVEPLLELLGRLDYQDHYHNQELRTAVLRVLGLLRDVRAVEPLLRLLESGRVRRNDVLDALGRIGDRRALPFAEHYYFHAPDVLTKSAARRAYIALADRSDLDRIVDMLYMEDTETRLMAIRLLGMLQDDRAVEPLLRVLHHPDAKPMPRSDGDPDRLLRVAVMQALASIGDNAAVPHLRRYWLMPEAWSAIREIQRG